MSGKTIGIMHLRQIIQYRKQGVKNRKISQLLGINRNTVNAYVKMLKNLSSSYDELLGLDDASLEALLTQKSEKSNPRYEQLTAQFEHIYKELKKPGATMHALWKAYIAQHPDGYGYTQFTQYYREWAQSHEVSYKLTHYAGEKLFVDYAGKKLPIVDRQTGEIKYVEVSVAILPASQMIFVEASHSQQKEDFINSLTHALNFYGGAPQAIVCDNLKAAVIQANKHEPVINKSLKDFGLYYNSAIAPTRPYKPQDKALVENAVRLVYQHIFYPLNQQTFFSLKELNEAITPFLERLNERMFSQVNYSRRELFHSVEKPYLQALPATDYEIRHFKRAKIQKMGHIFLGDDKHYYSVPYQYIGRRVEVRYSRSTVEIYYNNHRLCTHKRNYQPGKYTTDKQHLPSTHQDYNDWNPDYFRQKAVKIGDYTAEYVTRLIQQYAYPEHGYKQAQGIIQLTKEYDQNRIEQACKSGLTVTRYSYHTIKTILKNGTEQLERSFDEETHIPSHDNVRGPEAYQ